MPYIDNYRLFPIVKICAEGRWGLQRMMATNKISGVVRWFTLPELDLLKHSNLALPISNTTCVMCDTELREDKSCKHGCPQRSKA